jgi:hypothetical protein
MKWFSTEFQAFLSSVEGHGIEFPAFCVSRNRWNYDGMNQNSKLFYLLWNGSEWNSERFHSAKDIEFRWKESKFPSVPWNNGHYKAVV